MGRVLNSPDIIASKVVVGDDNTTNASYYPVWVPATPGSTTIMTSSGDLQYNPSLQTLYLAGSINLPNIYAGSSRDSNYPSDSPPVYISSTSSPLMNLTSSNSGGAQLILRSAGSGAGQKMSSSNTLGFLGFRGHDDSDYSSTSSASITAVATEVWSTTAHGTALKFAVTPNGSTSASVVTMYIDQNNYVGIGTTSPGSSLEVSSTTKVALDSANGAVWVTNSTSPNAYTGSNYDRLGIFFSSNIATIQTSAAGTGTLRPLKLMVGDTSYVYLDSSNRFGLGITPTSMLHVSGSGADIRLSDTSVSGADWRIFAASGGTKAFRIYDTVNGDRVWLDTNGNFGIYTTSPGAPLTVGGALALNRLDITLANGANENIAITGGSPSRQFTFARLTGPTTAFSIGGFTGGTNGAMIILLNDVAQTMTINHEDLSSTAANRITTLTAANVALRTTGRSVAMFIYSSVHTRWFHILGY